MSEPADRPGHHRHPRVLFLTVGKAPRQDMVPEIAALTGLQIDVHEVGILDDLSRRLIDDLTAEEGEPALVTYLTANIRVRLSREGVAARLNAMLAGIRPSEFDLVVILATGFPTEIIARGTVLNAQHAVESALLSLLPPGGTIGVIHPLATQLSAGFPGLPSLKSVHAKAGEGETDALLAALLELSEADAILLSSMSYGEEDCRTLARVTQRPVLLARRILAGAIRLVLLSGRAGGGATLTRQARSRLASLTPRQNQILDLVCAGRTSKQIAQALAISPKTVEVHRANIMNKMDAPSTGALISMVLGNGPGESSA